MKENEIDDIRNHLEHIEASLDLIYRADSRAIPFREMTLSTIADDGLMRLDQVRGLADEIWYQAHPVKDPRIRKLLKKKMATV